MEQEEFEKKESNTNIKPESYKDLLKANRKNKKIQGFDFDLDMFENLIDCFTPKDMVPIVLNCSHADLDRFCMMAYNMNYNETYKVLIGVADIWARRAVRNLAYCGNNTALKIFSEHFMGLKDEEQSKNAAPNITIVNDLGVPTRNKK